MLIILHRQIFISSLNRQWKQHVPWIKKSTLSISHTLKKIAIIKRSVPNLPNYRDCAVSYMQIISIPTLREEFRGPLPTPN